MMSIFCDLRSQFASQRGHKLSLTCVAISYWRVGLTVH